VAGYTIRAFARADAEAIAALTLAAIRQTALRAYSPEQVAAWSARYSPARLLESATRGDVILVAADAYDRPAAYTVLEADGHLDMLFCHPDHTARGLGIRLLTEAEIAARALGAERLYTEASELARPVFARAGYALLHRRDFTILGDDGEVAIHNYPMEKRFT
jgi:putative acetyltransferase